ncbi:hypothetical protein BN439_pEA290007 (plasmid) [Erwinia amylovora Ea644]|nr:hypothetical protein BN439_pEA290007 [Erwinia amylovora Ea644]CCP05035.1 hypothetical protein BN440_pEA290008 [Erwinia amylovora MR1]
MRVFFGTDHVAAAHTAPEFAADSISVADPTGMPGGKSKTSR